MACTVGRLRPYILLLLMMFAGIWMQGCVSTSHYVQEGRMLGFAGEWEKSVKILEEAHKKKPGDAEIKLLLERAKSNASIDHMMRGEALLKKGSFDEAVREFQLSIDFQPGNLRAEVLLRRAKAFLQSRTLFQQGEAFFKQKEYMKARKAFQEAVRLNPGNKEAEKALEAYRKEMEVSPQFRLKPKSPAPVSLRFKKTPITSVFEVLSRLTGINFIFDKDVKDSKVTLFMTDVPIVRFLEVLLQTNSLTGKLVNDKTMIIYPSTPAKIKEYEDLEIRTYYLADLKAKEGVALLSKILKSKDIMANEKLNALVIRGSKKQIEVASRLLEANDRPPAEVMLNVEILEVSRSKERQLGLEVNPTSVTFGIGETSPKVSADSVFVPNVSAYALGKITNKELLLSIPQATLNLLKQDADTRTLASPQIRIKTREKASFHVGERIPLRVNRRIDITGVVTYDYQYHDIGVKVQAEPVVNQNDEVSLKLALEISALGANLGTTDEPEYSIKTRKAESVLSIRDGEPVIIGGLISDEERKTVQKIPLLGDIPVIGHIFSNLDKANVEVDVVMAITPIIIRAQDIPSRDVSEIWSGRETEFSLQEPYESYAERRDRYLSMPKDVKRDTAQPVFQALKKAAETPSGANTPETSEKRGVPVPEAKLPIAVAPEKSVLPISSPERVAPALVEPAPKAIEKEAPATPPSVKAGEPEGKKNQEYFWPGGVAYSIHVNSFPTRGEAQVRLQKLSKEQFECFLVPVDIPGMGFYYRVFVGRFPDYHSAVSMCESLKGKKGFATDIHVASRKWAFGG